MELYFAKHEFTAKHHCVVVTTDSWSVTELLHWRMRSAGVCGAASGLVYTEASGHPGLREESLAVLQTAFRHQHVRTFAGAEEAIYAFFRATIAQGDEVIVFPPGLPVPL